MKRLILAVFVASMAGPVAAAECYADYKAKQDQPLRLHYGIAEVAGDCSRQSAMRQLEPRLAAGGWTLLNIVSVFGSDGLADRRENAGQFYLRY